MYQGSESLSPGREKMEEVFLILLHHECHYVCHSPMKLRVWCVMDDRYKIRTGLKSIWLYSSCICVSYTFWGFALPIPNVIKSMFLVPYYISSSPDYSCQVFKIPPCFFFFPNFKCYLQIIFQSKTRVTGVDAQWCWILFWNLQKLKTTNPI